MPAPVLTPMRARIRALLAVGLLPAVLLAAGCTAEEREPESPAASSAPNKAASGGLASK